MDNTNNINYTIVYEEDDKIVQIDFTKNPFLIRLLTRTDPLTWSELIVNSNLDILRGDLQYYNTFIRWIKSVYDDILNIQWDIQCFNKFKKIKTKLILESGEK